MITNVWWIDPLLWEDGFITVVSRIKVEDATISTIKRQAIRLDGVLVMRIIALDYDYLRDKPTLMPFERMQLIADDLGMSVHFVADVLEEVDEMLECVV